MYEYICYTKQGKFRFMADSDLDAMRKALWFCWRDNEDFIRVEYCKGCENYTLSIHRQQRMFYLINPKTMKNPPFFSHFIAFSDEQMLDLYFEACHESLNADQVKDSALRLLPQRSGRLHCLFSGNHSTLSLQHDTHYI